MNPRSLTGDPVTDMLVPVAMRLVGAVHAGDADGVDEAFADAITAAGGRCDPGQALAVVCAAMVAEDARVSTALGWVSVENAALVALVPAVDENKTGEAA